jgi:uncharacterized membrane protein YkvA (DUF1232 family)
MWIDRFWRFAKTVGRDGLALLFALRDPQTPRALKLATVALAFYVISPIDLLPDIAFLVGWTDDLALLALGIPCLRTGRSADRAPEPASHLSLWRA